MHAVIKIGSSQYLVSENQEFLVDLQKTEGDQFVTDQVLLIADGDKVTVGQPLVTGYKVVCEVLGEVKGEKIKVSKFKAKSRYRKSIGFRAKHTKLKVKSIGTGDVEKKETVVTPKPKKVRETKS